MPKINRHECFYYWKTLTDAFSCCEEDLGTYDEEGFILDLG